MITYYNPRSLVLAAVSSATMFMTSLWGDSTSGTWLGESGEWSSPSIWADGLVPDGPGATGTFNSPFEGDRLIRLDVDISLGSILYGNGDDGFLSLDLSPVNPNRVLTLDNAGAPPVIDAANRLGINARLDGTDGFVKQGPGMLRLRREERSLESVEGVFSFVMPDDGAGGEFEAVDARRYTTFFETRGGRRVVVTNSNAESHNNPGPGWSYLPTGIDWEPNTAYLIDFTVFGRDDDDHILGANIEYGLWGGFPDDDAGVGNYNNLFSSEEKPGSAATRPSLGTQGRVVMSEPTSNRLISVSEFIGTSEVDEPFVFVTGDDVSDLDDMVVFLRNGTDGEPNGPDARLHWTDLEVMTVPAEDYDDFINQPDVEPNLFTGTIELQEGSLQIGNHADAWGVDTDFLISGDAGFWTNFGGTPVVTQPIVLEDATMTLFGFPGNDRSVRFDGPITGAGDLVVDGETTNMILRGNTDFEGSVTVGPGGRTGGASNHTELRVESDSGSPLGNGANAVFLGGGEGASLFEGEEDTDGSSLLHFATPDTTFSGDISGRGILELDLGDTGLELGSMLHLTGNNTFEGRVFLDDGALRVDDVASFPTDLALRFASFGILMIGGDLAPDVSGVDFARPIGEGPGEVFWTNGAGFAAIGGDRTVNLGGNSGQIDWENQAPGTPGRSMMFGHPQADGTLVFENPIFLSGGGDWRNFRVWSGESEIDARLDGVLSSSTSGLIKNEDGTLQLNAANTYSGPTGVNAGTLAIGPSGSINSSSNIVVRENGVFDVSAANDFTVGSDQTLSGVGRVVGPITVAGVVWPGSITAEPEAMFGESLTFEQVTLTSQAFVNIDIDSSTGENTGLIAEGDVDLGGATLDLVDVASSEMELPPGTRFVILDYTDQTLTGEFVDFGGNPLPDGASIPAYLLDEEDDSEVNVFTINYNDVSDGSRIGNFVTLTIGNNPYEDWAVAAGLEGEDVLPLSDPDGDGVPNLLEYALGGNPLEANAGILPVLDMGDGANLIANSEFMASIFTTSGPLAAPFEWEAQAEEKIRGASTDGGTSWSDPIFWDAQEGSLGAEAYVQLPGWIYFSEEGDGVSLRASNFGSAIFSFFPGTIDDWEDLGGETGGDASTFAEDPSGHGYDGDIMALLSGERLFYQNRPAYAYVPTGVDWEPNTTYTIDMVVAKRFGGSGLLRYGLWAGLPDEAERAEGNSIGTTGVYDFNNLPQSGFGILSELTPLDDRNEAFTFTTGDDVSGLGEMYFFAGNIISGTAQLRIGWGEVLVKAEPVSPPSVSAPNRYNASAEVPVADTGYLSTPVAGGDLEPNTVYSLTVDLSYEGDRDWAEVRDDLVVQIWEGEGPGAVLDPSTVSDSSGQITLDYTAPATPVDLEIRIGSAGGPVSGEKFVFDNVTLWPSDQTAVPDYVFSFHRDLEAKEAVDLFFEFSTEKINWIRLPVEEGLVGPAVIELTPVDETSELVTVTLPGTLAVNGALYGRLAVDYPLGDVSTTQGDATVIIEDRVVEFDGDVKNVEAVTEPSGLDLSVTYNGTTDLPVDPGSYLVFASIDDPVYSGFGVATLVIESVGGSYDEWLANFPDLSEVEPDADPDGDGIPNLLEFVLDGDPLLANRAYLPMADVVLGANGEVEGFLFSFIRRQDSVESVDLEFQWSADLEAWSEGVPVEAGELGLVEIQVDAGDAGPGLEFVHILISGDVAEADRLFGRLRATLTMP